MRSSGKRDKELTAIDLFRFWVGGALLDGFAGHAKNTAGIVTEGGEVNLLFERLGVVNRCAALGDFEGE